LASNYAKFCSQAFAVSFLALCPKGHYSLGDNKINEWLGETNHELSLVKQAGGQQNQVWKILGKLQR
jgi:hypothetical protein